MQALGGHKSVHNGKRSAPEQSSTGRGSGGVGAGHTQGSGMTSQDDVTCRLAAKRKRLREQQWSEFWALRLQGMRPSLAPPSHPTSAHPAAHPWSSPTAPAPAPAALTAIGIPLVHPPAALAPTPAQWAAAASATGGSLPRGISASWQEALASLVSAPAHPCHMEPLPPPALLPLVPEPCSQRVPGPSPWGPEGGSCSPPTGKGVYPRSDSGTPGCSLSPAHSQEHAAHGCQQWAPQPSRGKALDAPMNLPFPLSLLACSPATGQADEGARASGHKTTDQHRPTNEHTEQLRYKTPELARPSSDSLAQQKQPGAHTLPPWASLLSSPLTSASCGSELTLDTWHLAPGRRNRRGCAPGAPTLLGSPATPTSRKVPGCNPPSGALPACHGGPKPLSSKSLFRAIFGQLASSPNLDGSSGEGGIYAYGGPECAREEKEEEGEEEEGEDGEEASGRVKPVLPDLNSLADQEMEASAPHPQQQQRAQSHSEPQPQPQAQLQSESQAQPQLQLQLQSSSQITVSSRSAWRPWRSDALGAPAETREEPADCEPQNQGPVLLSLFA